jgi:hypothetical protein
MLSGMKNIFPGISLVAFLLLIPPVNGCGGGGASGNNSGITRSTPTITWTAPAAITYGTALTTIQLNPTASVAGSFTFSPAVGSVLTAGTQTLTATFTPFDTTSYNSASASVNLVVNKATPVLTWATPASVTTGTVLNATQLNATAAFNSTTVPGSFVYSPVSGTVLSTVGTQTLSTTFTPTDSTDYSTASTSVSLTVTPSAAPSYSWGNVKIIAGGYVPALYFHPTLQNLRYLRTDMGGAYRWGPNDSQWVPLFDWISPSVWYYGGAEAIGLDPTDPNRLYVAVGEYASPTTGAWDGNGAMMVSTDQGASFTTVPLSFKNGSNDDGRNAGERIAVDPNLPATVYFGTRTAGLQISIDHGATWNKMTGLNVSTTANNSGIVSVVPVKSSGSGGSATPVVYVGVAGTGLNSDPVGLYVTTNAGSATSTFTAVSGQPTFTSASALAPLHAVLGPNGHIYVLYADAAGPNNITTSQLWEFTPTAGTWTSGTWRQIALPPNAAGNSGQAGYGGIDCDPSNAGVLLLSTIDQWYLGDTIYRSTNNGSSWTDVSRTGGTHDATLSPYLTFGSGSVTNVGSGNWVGKVSIDPFNSDHIYYGTGATIWTTTSMTSADSGSTVPWTVGGNGVEENSVGMVLAPPSGNTILLSGMGDIYGFAHTDLTKSPAQGMYSNPRMYPSGMDFEQNLPTSVVRVTNGTAPFGVFSSDGGMTWSAFATNPTGTTTGGGAVAIAPDGSSIVWATADTNSVWFSTNNGATWTAASGIPAQAQVVSDRVKPGVYYGYSGTSLYLSTNNGATWSVAQTALPSGGTLVILPDAQGNLYLSAGSRGLYSNTGTATAPTLSKSSSVATSTYFHFGKAAPGAPHLTLFVYGQINSITGLFRSVDNGISWIQINDATHQWGGGVNSITGDMRTFGTVYLGTNGRGIIWGTSTN